MIDEDGRSLLLDTFERALENCVIDLDHPWHFDVSIDVQSVIRTTHEFSTKTREILCSLKESCGEVVDEIIALDLSTVDSPESEVVPIVQFQDAVDNPSKNDVFRRIEHNIREWNMSSAFKEAVTVRHIPKTAQGRPSGKLMRKICQERHPSRPQDPVQAPSLNLEENLVRQTFAHFSTVPEKKIGLTQSIFQLGLDSINAIQISHVLRARGYHVSAQTVLQNATAASLAANLSQSSIRCQSFDFATFDQEHRPIVCQNLGIPEDRVKSLRPCTSVQAGMVARSLHSNGVDYLNHVVYRLDQQVSHEDVARAWNMVFKKFDMLRTGFVPLQNSNHYFAMICYRDDSWEAPVSFADTCSEVDENFPDFKDTIRCDILKSVRSPVWRVKMTMNQPKVTIDMCIHHGLYDAESLSMIMDNFQHALEDITLDPEPPMEPLLGRILMEMEDGDHTNKIFWQHELRHVVPLAFPDLTPVRSPRTADAVSVESSMGGSELAHTCRTLGVTLHAALQAAWATVLSFYVGERDVVFGVVFRGRESEHADATCFPCAVTVPFRCDVGGRKPDILKRAMDFNSVVRKHQFAPLTDIQRWSEQSGVLFDTILVLQKATTKNEHANMTTVHEETNVEYSLSVEANQRSDDSLCLRAVFKTDVIPAKQAKIILEQLDDCLRSLLVDEAAPTSTHRHESRVPAQTSAIASDVNTLHEFVEKSEAICPSRVALEFVATLDQTLETSKWTYSELNSEGEKVANLVTSYDLGSGKLIAVCFDKCPEASFAVVGILKAGYGFVALDARSPPARKQYVLQDSGAAMVITTTEFVEELQPLSPIPVVPLDAREVNKTHFLWRDHRRQAAPEDTCYCLYTSGSTGAPKGCLISHENAVQLCLAFQGIFSGRWEQHSRWFQFASFHFDVSVLELFWSWSVGICVVSAPQDAILEDLGASLRRLKISHIDLTPSLARLITPADVPTLCNGVFITGGEPLRQDILNAWGSRGVIHNGYGPTECTIGVTMYPAVPTHGKPSNIGWQFQNVGTYILQPGSDVIVPRGAVGELCISGKLVGQGYLNRPQLTQERFPILEETGERIYRTGDLVRLLHDCSFEFLGRIDDQVKLRGQRLELGEINTNIKKSDSRIDQVVTIVAGDRRNSGKRLISFPVVKNATYRPRSSDELLQLVQDPNLSWKILEHCKQTLAAYMIPSRVFIINRMPLTRNSKVDIKKLEAIFHEQNSASSGSPTHEAFFSSRRMDKTGEKVALALERCFGCNRDDLGPSTNVFHAGLDSISVFKLANTLKNEGFSAAKPSVILQQQTIESLANALSDHIEECERSSLAARQAIVALELRYRHEVTAALDISLEKLERIAPCTPLQQGFLAKSLKNNDGIYFNVFNFELERNVDTEGLASAWDRVFKHVPVLRTCFVPVSEGYVQVVLHHTSVPLAINGVRNEEQLHQMCEEDTRSWRQRNVGIVSKPCEISLYTGINKSLMVLKIFHGVYDANSLLLILKKCVQEYRHESAVDYGQNFFDTLPYGPLRQLQGAKHFWHQTLQNHTYKPLIPVGKTCDPSTTNCATLELDRIDSLERIRMELNVTQQAVFQAAWILSLNSFLQSQNTVGLVVSGRSIDVAGAEEVLGPLFNTIPFYVNLESFDTLASTVRKCHDFNIASLRFHHTPLRDIQKWAQHLEGKALFDTLFIFQKHTEDRYAEQKDIWTEIDDESTPDYPLSFEVEQRNGGNATARLIAQGTAVSKQGCANLLQEFERILLGILKDPEQSLYEVFGQASFQWLDSDDAKEWKPQRTNRARHSDDWSNQFRLLRDAVSIISEVNLEMIGPETSIFELGLDSIDAIRLSSVIKNHGYILTASYILRNPILNEMSLQMVVREDAPKIEDGATQKYHDLKAQLKAHLNEICDDRSGVEDVLPATPLQEAMVARMQASDYRDYLNHAVLKVRANVDVQKLKHAWSLAFSRIPILRTSFTEVAHPALDASIAQLIHKDTEFRWICVDVPDGNPNFDALFGRIRNAWKKTSSNIPLFQLSLVTTPQSTYLVISMSHALYDGYSIGLVHRWINAAYHGQPPQVSSCERILSKIICGSDMGTERFWLSSLHGSKGCLIDAKPKYCESGLNRHERKCRLDFARLRVFCKDQAITLQALGQACWSCVLATHTKNLDVVFGTVLSGREDEESQQAIFPTMNTVAIRIVLHGSRRELLEYIQANLADVLLHQHFPLRRLQKVTGLHTKNLFNTLFVMQRRPGPEEKQDALYDDVGGASALEYPICVEMEALQESLIWRTACSGSYFDHEETLKLLRKLDDVLESFMDEPEAPVIEFEGDEISVCDLPTFPPQESSRKDNNASVNIKDEYIGETSITESTIRVVLAQVSGLPLHAISGHSTVFDLGIDSINSIKVCALLKKENIRIGVSDLVGTGSVQNVARLVDQKSQPDEQALADAEDVLFNFLNEIEPSTQLHEAGIPEHSIEKIMPASPGQVYMLSVWHNSECKLFLPTFGYILRQPVSGAYLRKAWESLVSANPILRSVFVRTKSSTAPFIQVVLKVSEMPVTFLEPSQQFDMVPPVVRPMIELLAQTSEEVVTGFKLRIHHAMYDAVSLDLLLIQLQQLYENSDLQTPQIDQHTTTNFLALTYDPSSVQVWKAFWPQYLSGASTVPNRPFKSRSPSGALVLETYTPRIRHFRPGVLSGNACEILTSNARSHNISAHSAFFAAVAKSLALLSTANNDADIVIGIYHTNRSHLSSLPTHPYPTVNIVPLRVRLPLSTSLVELAIQVQKDLVIIAELKERMQGSLMEIWKETGVTVGVVVNWLGEATGHQKERNEWVKQDRSKENVGEDEDETIPSEAKEEDEVAKELREVYVPTIDIEAAIRSRSVDTGSTGSSKGAEGKGLDIGVFAPTCLMTSGERSNGAQSKDNVAREARENAGRLVSKIVNVMGEEFGRSEEQIEQ